MDAGVEWFELVGRWGQYQSSTIYRAIALCVKGSSIESERMMETYLLGVGATAAEERASADALTANRPRYRSRRMG